MRTNIQKDVKIPKSGFKRSRFDFSHDTNTTFGFGEVQPIECKLLVPNSKVSWSAKNLVRFAPLVSPTFGRVKLKTVSQFVPLEDVFFNLGSFLTQEPKGTSGSFSVQKLIPNVPIGDLLSWCLLGARATMYFAIATNDGKTAEENASEGNYITWYRQNPKSDSGQSDWDMHLTQFLGTNEDVIFEQSDTFNSSANGALPNIDCVVMNLNRLTFGASPVASHVRLACKNIHDLCPVRRDYKPNAYDGDPILEDYQKEVTFDSADFVLETKLNDEYAAIAFEFSDFGKRLRKILLGDGMQFTLNNVCRIAVTPLFATYKAYYDRFQPQRYESWEYTWCYALLKKMESQFTGFGNFFIPSKTSLGSNNSVETYFARFMLLELADMWYVERPDFYASHIDKLAISPVADETSFLSVNAFGDLGRRANVSVNASTTDDAYKANDVSNTQVSNSSVYNIPFINQLQHSQVDATFLARVTRWINKYTALGRTYDKIMRAFGFGKYLDKIDSHYIGSSDDLLPISDVVSMAATSDAVLGEFGGKGLGYSEIGKQVFENDVYGYWITLACIVPEAGYVQNIDLTLPCIRKFDMYQADFDAIGMEATTKESLAMNQYICNAHDSEQMGITHTFGYVPRSSRWKVHKNLVNGDFNRRGMRDIYLPYTLDKQLAVNDYEIKLEDYRNPQGALIYNFVRLDKTKVAGEIPHAGNWARMPTKFPWLGRFDRIFAKLNDEDNVNYSSDDSELIGWSSFNRDNFMMHLIADFKCYAPMKPIEESYGIEEEENPNQSGVEYVTKA